MKRQIIIGLFAAIFCSCVQKEHLKTVTFRVDMSAIEDVGEVAIKGGFTDLPWGARIKMSDTDGDKIYEVTVSQETAQNNAEFKFTHNEVFELQKLPNRVLKMEYKPEEILYTAVFNNTEGNQINNN